MNPVKALQKHGQAVWLDFLARGFIAKGDLKRLIENDGVRGVTSNPAIFEKAIGSSDEYDSAIAKALKGHDRPVTDLYEHLAIEDIRHAADVLRPTYDELNGADGFVSLEVSPYLAMDTKATIAEAERFWREVDRKNLMIKVPATPEGLPAIRHLTAKGISVNITLLFSQKVYEDVAEAYLAGLEEYVRAGGDPSHVASVASFFVSRIDSAVDKQLDDKIAKANDPAEKARLKALQGKVAIANAKLAYQHYKKAFRMRAGKSCKPRAPDRSGCCGPLPAPRTRPTVTYLCRRTDWAEYGQHHAAGNTGCVSRSRQTSRQLEQDVAGARRVLADLAKTGISLDAITANIWWRMALNCLPTPSTNCWAPSRTSAQSARRRHRSSGAGASRRACQAKSATSPNDWRAAGKIRRLWQHDKSVWTGADEDKWLGWLDSADAEQKKLGRLHRILAIG